MDGIIKIKIINGMHQHFIQTEIFGKLPFEFGGIVDRKEIIGVWILIIWIPRNLKAFQTNY